MLISIRFAAGEAQLVESLDDHPSSVIDLLAAKYLMEDSEGATIGTMDQQITDDAEATLLWVSRAGNRYEPIMLCAESRGQIHVVALAVVRVGSTPTRPPQACFLRSIADALIDAGDVVSAVGL